MRLSLRIASAGFGTCCKSFRSSVNLPNDIFEKRDKMIRKITLCVCSNATKAKTNKLSFTTYLKNRNLKEIT